MFNKDTTFMSGSLLGNRNTYNAEHNPGNSGNMLNFSLSGDFLLKENIKMNFGYRNLGVKKDEFKKRESSFLAGLEYIGPIMQLCQDRRGVYIDQQYFDATRRVLVYEIPLSEIIYNFFDKLKSYTKGYASLDYEISDYRVSDLAKMDILLNGDVIDALSSIVYKKDAYKKGLKLVSRLKEVIPRQQFEVPIQAAINGKVIARADVKAVRKDVLAKCYGGDISRKRKLLEKQKEGKKRMKMVGSVELPQEAFTSILDIGEDKD